MSPVQRDGSWDSGSRFAPKTIMMIAPKNQCRISFLEQPEAKWKLETVPQESCFWYYLRGPFLPPKQVVQFLTLSVVQFLALFSLYVVPCLGLIVAYLSTKLKVHWKPGGHIGGTIPGFLKFGCYVSNIIGFFLFNLFGGLLYSFCVLVFFLLCFSFMLSCFTYVLILPTNKNKEQEKERKKERKKIRRQRERESKGVMKKARKNPRETLSKHAKMSSF